MLATSFANYGNHITHSSNTRAAFLLGGKCEPHYIQLYDTFVYVAKCQDEIGKDVLTLLILMCDCIL